MGEGYEGGQDYDKRRTVTGREGKGSLKVEGGRGGPIRVREK